MTAVAYRARGRHHRPPAHRRALKAARHHRYALARNAAVTAATLAITAGFLLAAAHPRQQVATPHCLRAQNCRCRELGEWMPGHNRCAGLPQAAGKENGR